MKTVWLWMAALALPACGSGEEGGERGSKPPPMPDGGTPDLTCETDGDCDGDNAVCNETTGECACADGYHGDADACEDIDECANGDHDCGAAENCVNRDGDFSCACIEGTSRDGDACANIDECSEMTASCDPNAVCTDLDPVTDPDPFSCECEPGFSGDGMTCQDTDECAESDQSDCPENAHCVNILGGATCSCDPGFDGDGTTECIGLCEIAKDDPNVCAPEGLCRIDGFAAECAVCEPGFTGDGKSCTAATCDAECDGSGDDADHAICTSEGCECAPGFEGDVGNCSDVDECVTDNGGCGNHATCQNTEGGFICACDAGYRAEDGSCVDADECSLGIALCHPNAVCTNEDPEENPDGYSCECEDGFTGNGLTCQDVNECATDNGGCPADAECVNTPGSSTCGCPDGALGEPGNCYCDLSGLWAMRQDVDTCWPARFVTEGTATPLVSSGNVETTAYELQELTYDGETLSVKKKGCGANDAPGPDLISTLFRETYSSYIPIDTFDDAALEPAPDNTLPKLLPGSTFQTQSEAAVLGIDLGDDPLNAPWPDSYTDVAAGDWTDPDGDGEPGITLWPRLPSETTLRGGNYSYLPARPGTSGNELYAAERAGCVSVAARVIGHIEGTVRSCSRITGSLITEKTQGRVHSCTLVPKNGACNPNDLDDCPGYHEDISCSADDWANASASGRCNAADLGRLDDDQNQANDTDATFELIKIGELGDSVSCEDVRTFDFGSDLDRSGTRIRCETPE